MQSFYSLLWYCHFCIHTLLSGHLSNLLLCIHNCGIDQDLEGVLALQAPDSHLGNSSLMLLLRSSLTPTGTHFLTRGLYHFWPSDRFWQLVHWPSHSPFYRFFNFLCHPICWFPNTLETTWFQNFHLFAFLELLLHKHQTMLCSKCQHNPCHCIMDGAKLRRVAMECSNLPSNTARCTSYQTYTISSHGWLGTGNCIKIPTCIIEFICELHPEPTGDYMGHRWM